MYAPVLCAASNDTSGKRRLLPDCHAGAGSSVLTPPPVAHSLPLLSSPSFQTVSLENAPPDVVYSVVPPIASTCGDEAGRHRVIRAVRIAAVVAFVHAFVAGRHGERLACAAAVVKICSSASSVPSAFASVSHQPSDTLITFAVLSDTARLNACVRPVLPGAFRSAM
ncbi:hypothetical protein L0Y93_26510 [Burkholderia multivorans]|uniref:hypothetical protein n=1 Tax=Burkholderia multivorans TaxID=87883 RepID=UPI00207D6BE5|nr:hypothetical protein [Burkholderia multivorans]MCO1465100.1 hypothetical protein [Burkholderia multivorans]